MRKKYLITMFSLLLATLLLFCACSIPGANEDTGGTNVQELGIDEGDKVKVYGDTIYKLQTDGLSVSRFNEGKLTLISTYKIKDIEPMEMYVNDNLLISLYDKKDQEDKTTSIVNIFDISQVNTRSLGDSLLYTFSMEGETVESRLALDSKTFFMAISCDIYSELYHLNKKGNYERKQKVEPFHLSYLENGVKKETEIVEKLENTPNKINCVKATVFLKMNLNDTVLETKTLPTFGLPIKTLYVSPYGFYAAYEYSTIKNNSGCFSGPIEYHDALIKIDVQTMKISAQKYLDNIMVSSRHAIKDTGEYVYVVAVSRDSYLIADGGRKNMVSILALDKNLNLVGNYSEIASDKEVGSVSYENDGDKLYCYISTKREDPVFKIDITDPNNMKRLGQLELNAEYGFSYSFGEGLLVGIGKNTEYKLNVGLFDVSSDTPQLLSSDEENHLTECEVLSDSRAFCVNKELKLFAFSVKCSYRSGGVTIIKQGALIYGITEQRELKRIAFIKAIDTSYSDPSNLDFFARDYVNRILAYGNYVYTVSDGYITSYNIEELISNKTDAFNSLHTRTK